MAGENTTNEDKKSEYGTKEYVEIGAAVLVGANAGYSLFKALTKKETAEAALKGISVVGSAIGKLFSR